MPSNNFLTWATGTNANVLTQTQYAALGNLTSGVVAGTASGQLYNKSVRQTSIIASMIAQFIVDRLNVDAIDDGTIATLEANFILAVRSVFVIPPTGVVAGTYGPTMTLAVQADGRITSLANVGLPTSGVSAGTYVGTTVTVANTGIITGISSVAYGQIGGFNTWTNGNNFVGSIGNLILRAVDANGANFQITGNGTGSALTKYIRVLNSQFQIINSGYTAAILTLGDGGGLTVTGAISAGAAISTPTTISATGQIASSNNLFAGTSISAGTTITAGSNIVSTGGIVQGVSLQSSAGNVTANSGRLRASLGATASGDANCATILNDFPVSLAGNGWMMEPNGLVHQWGSFGAVAGVGPQVFALARSWPQGVPLNITISYLCHNNPQLGSIGADFSGAANGQALYQNTAVSGTHGVYWYAKGF